MPLVAAKITKDVEDAVFSKFKEVFSDEISSNPDAETQYEKTSKAVAALIEPLIMAILNDALVNVNPGGAVLVNPGIPTAGSPAAQVTTAPGNGTITGPQTGMIT
jgi:hypothetical protein